MMHNSAMIEGANKCTITSLCSNYWN